MLRRRTTGIGRCLQQHLLLHLPLLSALAAGARSAATVRAESSPLTEEFFFGDLPPVLSATRLPQPLFETPASVTVIDRHMIEASGATTIPDTLRLVPGIQVGHIDGYTTVVTYHFGQNLTGDYYDYDVRRAFDKRYFVNLSLKSK